MTKAERAAYTNWKREMTLCGDDATRLFNQMKELFEECGGGKASCSLEGNLAYLLTSDDKQTRDRALSIYNRYYSALGHYDAFLQLGQAFADVQA